MDTIWISGGEKDRVSATARNSANIGRISIEWKARLTRSSVTLRPSASSAATAARTASSGPDNTTESGPLTAANDTSADNNDATSASVARTATMTPPS
ncbi:MAG TPA: hypothetical protein VHX38_38530, partial [Pseudonocardiaceae bacterium]|nr:hypothetical protein [Pseudonocardiaceae bacterium]